MKERPADFHTPVTVYTARPASAAALAQCSVFRTVTLTLYEPGKVRYVARPRVKSKPWLGRAKGDMEPVPHKHIEGTLRGWVEGRWGSQGSPGGAEGVEGSIRRLGLLDPRAERAPRAPA